MPHHPQNERIVAILLVGGPSTSTAFRPLTLTTPKPLFPICGKPILQRQLEWMTKSALIDQIFVLGFFENQPFEVFLQKMESELKIQIKYLREFENLGTAGGLYHFREVIMRSNPSQLLIYNSDTLTSFNLADLVEFHGKKKSDFTIVTSQVEPDQATNFGTLVVTTTSSSDQQQEEEEEEEVGEVGRVRHFVEKPHSYISNTVNCGIYLMESRLLESIEQCYKRNEKTSTTPHHVMFERNVIPQLMEKHRLFSYSEIEYWKLIKTPNSVLDAVSTLLVKEQSTERVGCKYFGNCYIHPTAQIDPTAHIGPNAIIGEGCIIESGVCIKNSILMSNVVIKANSFITQSIIGPDSVIDQWVRIEGTGNSGSGKTKKHSVTILSGQNFISSEVVVRDCIVLPNKELKMNSFDEILM